MSVRFTDEQLRELDRAAGQALSIIDPRNFTEYVLISRTEYERHFQEIDEEADPRRFSAEAARRLFQTLDEEEQQHRQTW